MIAVVLSEKYNFKCTIRNIFIQVVFTWDPRVEETTYIYYCETFVYMCRSDLCVSLLHLSNTISNIILFCVSNHVKNAPFIIFHNCTSGWKFGQVQLKRPKLCYILVCGMSLHWWKMSLYIYVTYRTTSWMVLSVKA